MNYPNLIENTNHNKNYHNVLLLYTFFGTPGYILFVLINLFNPPEFTSYNMTSHQVKLLYFIQSDLTS